MRNHYYENDFDLHENETACRTHFDMNGFARRLVLIQRQKVTQNWPIQKPMKRRKTLRGLLNSYFFIIIITWNLSLDSVLFFFLDPVYLAT